MWGYGQVSAFATHGRTPSVAQRTDTCAARPAPTGGGRRRGAVGRKHPTTIRPGWPNNTTLPRLTHPPTNPHTALPASLALRLPCASSPHLWRRRRWRWPPPPLVWRPPAAPRAAARRLGGSSRRDRGSRSSWCLCLGRAAPSRVHRQRPRPRTRRRLEQRPAGAAPRCAAATHRQKAARPVAPAAARTFYSCADTRRTSGS